MIFLLIYLCIQQFLNTNQTSNIDQNKYNLYNTEIVESLLYIDEISSISISSCFFHDLHNIATGKGGCVYISGDLINTTITQTFFYNSTANSAGSLYIDDFSTELSKSCIMMCNALYNEHAMFCHCEIGSYTSNTFYKCQTNQNNSIISIVTKLDQKDSTKVTSTNYTQNQVNGDGSILELYEFEEIFFVNVIFDKNENLNKDLLSATYDVRLFFGDSIVVDNSVSYIFQFYSCGSRQVFNSYFIGNGNKLFNNCDTAEMIITDCVFDFSIEIPYVTFRNCSISNTSTYSYQGERCYIPITKNSKSFFTTTGGIITIVVICIAFLLIVFAVVFIIYIKMKRKKESDNFYTDKFFTEYLNKTSLVTIGD